ncbi:hypothetical protein [Streptomyces sp. SLBN-8D4]|jgi:hypothetical protein
MSHPEAGDRRAIPAPMSSGITRTAGMLKSAQLRHTREVLERTWPELAPI